MDIVKLVQLGEGYTLEFKRNTESLASVVKTAIAFANTAGGIILIGVEDNGEIVGVDNPSHIQEQLANALSNCISPQLVPEIGVEPVDDLMVVTCQIEHATEPYYLNEKGEAKGVYVRIGNSNRQAGPEVIQEIKRANHALSFDKKPCDGVTEADLDKAKLDHVYGQQGHQLDTNKLMSQEILTKKGRKLVATNGGVILFGKPETQQKHFPYAEVRCARFKGTSRSEFIDRLNIEGGVLTALQEVPKFIRRNTRMAGKFGGMRRRDIPEYPVQGIREALTNAIAHANYEVSGSRIFVAIYDDRLEIQNPGIMMPGMSIEQFKAGVSRIRNPVIARALGYLELVEEWGSGYKRIKEACEAGGYPLPKWEEFGSALRVTFYPHPEVVELGQSSDPHGTQLAPSWHPVGTKLALSWHQAGTKLGLDPEMIQLIDFCRKPKSSTEIEELLGWTDRTKLKKRYIQPLMDKGYIERTIPDKPRSPRQKYVTTEKGLVVLASLKPKDTR